MELPLTATALNKRNGVTIIGSVGNPDAIVTINLNDDSTIQPKVDANGSFIAQLERKKAFGDIRVIAVLRDDLDSRSEMTLHVVAPKAIVTAVLSTQGIMRKLTGSVNQPGLFIEVHTPENVHPIEVVVDENFEFELQMPIALRPEDIKVVALNPQTGEQIDVPVELGVTTKTMTIPILTDDMITSYAAEAEQRRAAEEAHDQALMAKAAASEAFVTSIVETLQPTPTAINEKAAAANKETEIVTAATDVLSKDTVIVEVLQPTKEKVETVAADTESNQKVESEVKSRAARKPRRGIMRFFHWLFVRG
ncbi:hypothetical protein H9L19_05900 [Weissella diestrammenae]|uniref:Uncharacterized protein n=1 Tax=Weissella diestrammenae TaxID=1162633 RepID=A0A7G9T498_9LACO|nr:hypothetical protein [Weissella diestrammenae]MCM0583454.1 hypothetical protein [Weissella diestrammenae]QNN74923.1 hypothetical protein H9L19_05900 [Weissella diestrammenae]